MDILMIASEYPPTPGGLANYTYFIAKNLQKKYNLKMLVPRKKLDGFYGRIEAFKIIKNLMKEIDKYKYDTVYTITFSPHVAFIVNRIKKDAPLVVHGVGLDIYTNFPTFVIARKILYKASKKIICGANFQKKIMIKEGCNPEKISVITGGVDTELFKPAPHHSVEELRDKFNLNDKFLVLTIGRLIRRKGFDIAIKAMYHLKDLEDVVLAIVGKGPEEKNLHELIRKLSLNDKVKMLGFLPSEDIPVIYSAADVLVAPFRVIGRDLEGFPLVVQESQACSTPVITTPTAGIPELINNKRSGYLVRQESPKEIANKILMLYEDEKLLKKMSKNARDFAVKNLDYKIVVKKIEGVLMDG